MQTGVRRAAARSALFEALDLYRLAVIGLIEVTRWCDSPRLRRTLVRAIAGAAYRWSRKRPVIDAVVKRAFPRAREDERKTIVRQVFLSQWEEIFSYAATTEDLRAVEAARLEGAERLRAALAEGHGAILWTSAFGRRLAARAVLHRHGFAVCQVHGAGHLGEFSGGGAVTCVGSALIRRFVDSRIARWVSDIVYVPRTGSLALVRELQQRLDRNTIVCMTGDVKSGQRLMSVRILGTSQYFPAGLMSLAQVCAAPILPMYCVTEADGCLRVVIEEPVRIAAEAHREHDHQRALERLAEVLESYIARYPGQYRSWDLLDSDELTAQSPATQPRAA